MSGFPQTDLPILTGCPRKCPVYVLPTPLYFSSPGLSALDVGATLLRDGSSSPPSLHVLMESLPQILPTKIPHPGPALSTCSKERPPPRSSLRQTVSSRPGSPILSAFSATTFLSALNPVFFPTPAQGPAHPLLCGAPEPWWDSGFNQTETEQASSSALLKLAIPSQFLRGFEERTHAEGPAQCQA